MNAKWLLGAELIVFVLALPSNAAAPPPNVVLILADDLGWWDLGCYGSVFHETPHLDRLAGQGMRFTDAYAACNCCSPTRASILTGKYPARLHVTDWIPGTNFPTAKLRPPAWLQHLPPEEVTLAEALQAAGYATAAVGKWHLGREPFLPQSQGFDVNVAGNHSGAPGSYFWPYGHGDPARANRYHGGPVPDVYAGGRPGEYLTDRLTDEALKFIEANRERPFFLYLAHYHRSGAAWSAERRLRASSALAYAGSITPLHCLTTARCALGRQLGRAVGRRHEAAIGPARPGIIPRRPRSWDRRGRHPPTGQSDRGRSFSQRRGARRRHRGGLGIQRRRPTRRGDSASFWEGNANAPRAGARPSRGR